MWDSGRIGRPDALTETEFEMAEDEVLKARLDEIGARISNAEERLKLKGLLHKDHELTIDGLSKRYQILSGELDGEVADLQSHGERVGSFEKTVLNWVNGLNFDH